MLSLDFGLSVPGYSASEIGFQTMVRSKVAKLQVRFTNDGRRALSALSVRPVMESYLGQDKPLLFQRPSQQTIEVIPGSGVIELTFDIFAHFPGLVSVAMYVTDASNKAIMMKRKEDTTYQETPVRWWFYAIDNISVETLRQLKSLTIQRREKKQ